jgi:HAMP domain-containing protein
MNYEDLANGENINLKVDPPTDEEVKAYAKKGLIEAVKREREARNEKLQYAIILSNPENTQQLKDLTSKAAITTLQSEITIENVNTEPFKDFDSAEKEVYSKGKHKAISRLNNTLQAKPEIKEGIDMLKSKGVLDGRKQRYKKTPNDWISLLANSKLISDMADRMDEHSKSIASLQLAQTEVNLRLDRIESTQIAQETKMNALSALGIDQKKIDAYRLRLENPELTMDEIASLVGKTRDTVQRWLREIKATTSEAEQLHSQTD